MTIRSEFNKDVQEFIKKNNVFGITLLILLFLFGVALVIAGFYIIPDAAPGETRIEVEGHTFATPGNLLQVIGIVTAGIPLYAFYKIIGRSK